MANLNIYIDDKLIKQTEDIFDKLGISFSAATTIFFEQVVHCNGIPFNLHIDPFYSDENQKRLLISKERMENGGGSIHEMIDVDD